MSKLKIAVLFGGQSSEHEISCISAVTVIQNIDRNRYDLLLIGITKEGCWVLTESVEAIQNGRWKEGTTGAVLSPDASVHGVLLLEDGRVTVERVDVAFPVLHGRYGEDGTIQGILELAQIPYVGCGVLSSAVSMDKLYTKIIVDTLGVAQARYLPVQRKALAEMDSVVESIEETFTYPVFVKPSNAGSSKGVSKASDREELKKALQTAADEDYKILVEEAIAGRELECAVLGGSDVRTSGVGEILPAAEFYDYEAKYHNEDSKTVLSPSLPEGKAEELRLAAADIFRAVDGLGLARVDFFLEIGTNRIVFNEINTIPGFTSISMYPMLWEEQGLPKPQLVEALIQTAFLRRVQL